MDPPPVVAHRRCDYLGECYAHLGEPALAREAFEFAVSFGIDWHHAQLAAQRVYVL